ncbi:MAG: hypothetical protein GQF41_3350 [Candidatus Rifleibacterium amylolyticum]|nr:MAG: hypothetical protein GQF41_3350 [Candidatus Rifleibacterium amylolyticum]
MKLGRKTQTADSLIAKKQDSLSCFESYGFIRDRDKKSGYGNGLLIGYGDRSIGQGE